MEFVTNKTLEKLKYDLVRDGLISYEDIERANELALSQNVNIGHILIKSGLITETNLLKFLEGKLHIPYVDLKDYTLDKSMLNSKFFNKYQDYISVEELEDSNLWENMVQEEKRKLMVRIVSEA